MAAPFTIGDSVVLSAVPPYLKTADPMPMLRPPDVVPVGTQGIILDQRPQDYWGVRFPQGAFLVQGRHLRLARQP